MPVRKLLPATAAQPPPAGLGKFAARIPFDKNTPFRFYKTMTTKTDAKITVDAVNVASRQWLSFLL
jgi:hypothetical protein